MKDFFMVHLALQTLTTSLMLVLCVTRRHSLLTSNKAFTTWVNTKIVNHGTFT